MHYNDEQTKDCVMCASSEKLNCEVSWELFKTTYTYRYSLLLVKDVKTTSIYCREKTKLLAVYKHLIEKNDNISHLSAK